MAALCMPGGRHAIFGGSVAENWCACARKPRMRCACHVRDGVGATVTPVRKFGVTVGRRLRKPTKIGVLCPRPSRHGSQKGGVTVWGGVTVARGLPFPAVRVQAC